MLRHSLNKQILYMIYPVFMFSNAVGDAALGVPPIIARDAEGGVPYRFQNRSIDCP